MYKLVKNEFIKNLKSQIFLSFVLLVFIFLLFILNNFNPIVETIYYIIPMIGIILIVTSCSIMTNEFKCGTFKIYLTKPIKRWKIFVSKLLYLIILLFYYLMLSSIIYVVIYLYSDIKLDINKLLTNYFLFSIPILFLLTFSLCLSTIFNKSNIILAFSLVVMLCGPLLSEILFQYNIDFIQYTFLPYMDYSVFLDAKSINIINMEFGVNLSLFNGNLIICSYSIFFVLLALIIFNKKDINN